MKSPGGGSSTGGPGGGGSSTGAPGGGGLLIIEADSFKVAKSIIEKDPMILNGLVKWKLQEWIPIGTNHLQDII